MSTVCTEKIAHNYVIMCCNCLQCELYSIRPVIIFRIYFCRRHGRGRVVHRPWSLHKPRLFLILFLLFFGKTHSLDANMPSREMVNNILTICESVHVLGCKETRSNIRPSQIKQNNFTRKHNGKQFKGKKQKWTLDQVKKKTFVFQNKTIKTDYVIQENKNVHYTLC